MKTGTLIIIVLLALGLGFILYPIIRPCKENTIISTDTVYVYHTIRDTIYPAPVTIIKRDTVYPVSTNLGDFIEQGTELSTDFDISSFLVVNSYDDILKDDPEGFIRLREKTQNNIIFDRELIFESRCRDKIITNTVVSTGFYTYGSVLSDLRHFGASAGILYQNKRQRLYGASIGFYEHPFVSVGYGFKF